MGERRSRWLPTFAPCPACTTRATPGLHADVIPVRHAHWSAPRQWRTPAGAALIVAVVAALGLPWLDQARDPALPPTAVLASQLLHDPDLVHRVQVDYLSTSWQDTDGTHHTLTGLPELAASAGSSGIRGRAARAGLARIDDAVRSLSDRDPQVAHQVAATVAGVVPPQALEAHLPVAHALLHHPWRG